MNNNLKNVILFIKEALEKKNKNIYTINNYEIHIDFGQFYRQFKELVEAPDYENYNINSDETIFKIKYIKESEKKEIPEVPNNLKDYIFIKDGNDIISNIDDLEKELDERGLLSEYKHYDSLIKEINKFNNLIDLYNSKYMQFYNIYKRISDYEEKLEIIYGKKLLIWNDNQNNKIERYIYEANLDISVDSINNIISFTINKDKFRGLASEFLNLDSYNLKDANLFNSYVKEFNEKIVNEGINLNSVAQKYINYASLENEIVDVELNNNEEIKPFKTYLFNNSGIIVRNKSVKIWIEDLEKIASLCNSTKFLSPILNMFEVDFSNEEQVFELLNDRTYEYTKDEEVLFPLASNDEQYKIVDKVKSSNIVLVQGPPGTGKSHTIANLISHYISDGKRVIVTSEKAKALEVLRDKIPEQIRSLSLALLTSKGVDKDLEFSINNVLRHQEDNNELEKNKKNIEELYIKLKTNREKKQEVMRKIIDLMSKDTVSHKEELNSIMDFEGTNNLTLMDIAIWLDKNKQYSLVPITDNANYSYLNVESFFEKLDDICDDIRNNSYAISTNIPDNEYLKSNEIELYIKECIGYKNYKFNNKDLINAVRQTDLVEETIIELGSRLSLIEKIYDFFDKNWIKNNIKYEVFITKIKEIIALIKEKKQFIISTEEKLYDYNVEFYDEKNEKYYQGLIDEILKLYDEKGCIHLFNKLKFNLQVKKLAGITLNNSQINKETITQKDLLNVKDIIDYYILMDLIKNKIEKVLSVDLFQRFNIDKNNFGKYQDDVLILLDIIVNYGKNANEIDNCLEKVLNKNLFSISYLDSDEEYIKSIYNDLKYYVIEKSSVNRSDGIINELRNYYKDYNLQNLEKVLISIETNQLTEFITNKNSLLHEINVINRYNDLKKMYSNLVLDKQEFIRNYIYKFTFAERSYFKANIDKIFKYHYLEKYYLVLEEKSSKLPDLYKQREELIRIEKKIVEELIAAKGWYYQNQNMSFNISTSLNKWVNLKKKLGGGTGKNTNLYLRQMREEMDTAKNAIPVWIMPIDKLIEQYPFTNDPPFDVLIMDESSQSSVFSVSALSRAKKIIIVGDDKQISPTNAFTSIDGINDIRAKYLTNNTWDLQISKDTSIYDIIQTVCGNKKITLTEHFRCLPEIIRFSNKEFYNMEINPLKVRGKENTIEKPIETIYVSNAVCKKSGTQLFNQAEIDRIIMLLGEIEHDKQYDNKTIGIIALQNGTTKYNQKLTEIIMQKFGEEFVKKRKIKIGITYDFQGDERDVIILSMVISSVLDNGEKYSFRALTTQEFDRSFNVAASRAKEQMILVHSVKLDELSPNCNRYKLLNYCLNYDNETDKDNEKLFESSFEKDLYYYLSLKGYKLTPQFKVGNYRIDFVLTNDNNQKIAIECDGDIYHGIDELDNDLKRQSILERCGWKFARIRASEFYYNKKESTEKLIQQIEYFLSGNDSISYNVLKKSDENTIKSLEIRYDNKEESKVLITKNSSNGADNIEFESDKSNSNDKIFGFGTNQFKYMTLYSNGISKKAISDYYNVTCGSVTKVLQSVCNKYRVYEIDDCVNIFKEQFSSNKKFLNIIEHFNKKNNNTTNIEQSDEINSCTKAQIANCLNIVDIKIITDVARRALIYEKNVKIQYSEKNMRFILKIVRYYEKNGIYYLKAVDNKDNKIKTFRYDRIVAIDLL